MCINRRGSIAILFLPYILLIESSYLEHNLKQKLCFLSYTKQFPSKKTSRVITKCIKDPLATVQTLNLKASLRGGSRRWLVFEIKWLFFDFLFFFFENLYTAWILSDVAVSKIEANLKLQFSLLGMFANKTKAKRKTKT